MHLKIFEDGIALFHARQYKPRLFIEPTLSSIFVRSLLSKMTHGAS
jgi:hypothetical protein